MHLSLSGGHCPLNRWVWGHMRVPPFPERDNGFSCGKPSGQELSSGSPQDVPDGPPLAERGADFRDGVAEGAGPELSQETEESAAFLSQ